jgi:hypothetical protein
MPGRTPPAPRAALSDTAQTLLGVGHVLTIGGVKRAELRADSALVNEAVDHVELRAVRIMFFSPIGDTLSSAAAPAATYNLRTLQVALHGGATVTSRAGSQLTTARIVYDAAADRLFGDTTYTIGSRSGKGFEADPALRSVRAPKPPAAPGTAPASGRAGAPKRGRATATPGGAAAGTRPPG